MKNDKFNTNPTVDNRLKRRDLKCSICPPNKGENKKRQCKHGKSKSKKKDHRK